MQDGPARRRWRDVGIATVVLWAPLVAALAHATRRPWVPTADNALIELRALDVPTHLPLVGVYSRFGFHHPGPLLFLADAVPVHVLGPKGLLLATAAINGVALLGLAILFDRRGGRPLLVAGTLVLLVLERATAEQLLDPWNPWITTLPFAFLVVAVWSVWCRDWAVLPWAAIAATFVLQAHVGFALLAGGALALLLGGAAWSWWRSHRADRAAGAVPACRGRTLLVTLGVVLVLWLPPVLDQLTQQPGNVSRMLDAFTNPAQPPAGGGQAADVFVHGIGTSVPWLTGDEPVEPFSDRVLGAPWWTLLPVLLVFGAGLVSAWRVARRARADDDRDAAATRIAPVVDAARGQLVVLGAVVVGFVSATRINGDTYPYLVRWVWVLGAFAWLTAGWSLFTAWRLARSDERSADLTAPGTHPPADTRSPGRVASGAALAVVVAVAVAAVAAAWRAPLPWARDAEATLAVVNPSIDTLRAYRTILVRHEGTDLAEIPQGVYAELERRGLPVYVAPQDAFVAGEHRALGDRVPDAVLYVATKDAVGIHLVSGDTPLATYDGLTPEERAEYETLGHRGAVAYDEATKGLPLSDPLSPSEKARLDALVPRATRVFLFLQTP